MATISITQRDITRARCWLADLALSRANEMAERVGFGWRAASDAPDTFEEVVAEFTECKATGRDMRVDITNMVPSVFGSARAAAARQFWRNVAHVEMDADFGHFDVMKVAEAHLVDLVAAGMPQDTVAWQLMRADTVGQNYVFLMTRGGFVPDQLAFATTAVKVNLPYAVLDAVEQIEGRPICGRDTETLLRLMEDES